MSDSDKTLEKQAERVEKKVITHMTKEAYERFCRVKMTHPQVAYQALALLANIIEKHHTQRIDDMAMKRLLSKIKR